MTIKEIFSFYAQQDCLEGEIDLVKLKRDSKEYIDRTIFFIAIFGNSILLAAVFICLFVNEFDIGFSGGYVVLIILGCVWSLSVIQFLKKKERLQQIITYPNYRCMPAKCIYVTQMNMVGIRYEFVTSSASCHRFQINALKQENYVMDVSEGDEVCIVQFFSTYYVVFPTCKNFQTRTSNDVSNIFLMSNFNRRQRNAFLACYISGFIIMAYLVYDIVINKNKEFSMAVVGYILVFVIMIFAIIKFRTKEQE